MQLYVKHPRTT